MTCIPVYGSDGAGTTQFPAPTSDSHESSARVHSLREKIPTREASGKSLKSRVVRVLKAIGNFFKAIFEALKRLFCCCCRAEPEDYDSAAASNHRPGSGPGQGALVPVKRDADRSALQALRSDSRSLVVQTKVGDITFSSDSDEPLVLTREIARAFCSALLASVRQAPHRLHHSILHRSGLRIEVQLPRGANPQILMQAAQSLLLTGPDTEQDRVEPVDEPTLTATRVETLRTSLKPDLPEPTVPAVPTHVETAPPAQAPAPLLHSIRFEQVAPPIKVEAPSFDKMPVMHAGPELVPAMPAPDLQLGDLIPTPKTIEVAPRPPISGPFAFPRWPNMGAGLESGAHRITNILCGDEQIAEKSDLDIQQAILYCWKLCSHPDASLRPNDEQKVGISAFFEILKAHIRDDQRALDMSLYLGGMDELQRILSPRLDAALNAYDQAPESLLEVHLARAELAQTFGVGLVSTAGGVNGAKFIKTLEGNAVGVFKSPQAFQWTDFVSVFKYFFGQMRLLNTDYGSQEYAEVLAHQLSEALGFDGVAPKAMMSRYQGKDGAFIAFLDGFKELKTCVGELNERDSFSEEELYQWQMMVIWNFLIGNLDPHFENIFVRVSNEGVIELVKMIDHGNCFPMANPGALGAKGNLGKWGECSISEWHFVNQTLEFISQNLSEDALNTFIDADENRKKYFKLGMRQGLLQRARLLRDCVATQQIISPEQLGKVRTDAEFALWLTKV